MPFDGLIVLTEAEVEALSLGLDGYRRDLDDEAAGAARVEKERRHDGLVAYRDEVVPNIKLKLGRRPEGGAVKLGPNERLAASISLLKVSNPGEI